MLVEAANALNDPPNQKFFFLLFESSHSKQLLLQLLQSDQDYINFNPLFYFNQVDKLEADPRTRMPQHFQEEAAYCSHLVLWLDCDREGENICFEVMKNCCPDPTDKWNEARECLELGYSITKKLFPYR